VGKRSLDLSVYRRIEIWSRVLRGENPLRPHLTRRHFIAASAASLVPAAGAFTLQGRPAVWSLLGDDRPTGTAPNESWKQSGVLDLSKSPYARLKTLPVSAVVIQEGFWSKRRTTNVDASIPSMRDQLLEHGRMDNFLRLTGKSDAPQRGPVYSDSDIYKWTEAVGFALQSGSNPQLRDSGQKMIREVVAAQEPSGYLNTYYVGDHKSERMLPKTQTTGHELYNIGHLLQGAIAWYRATGDPTLLDGGVRFVDDFLIPNYGPGANQTPIVAGHPEIEMSLIELYRTTGNRKYIELAGYILKGDERVPLTPQQITYMYCGVPFTSRTRLEGHAVRAMYACCGATDYYLETGDEAYRKTLSTLWDDLSEHQMYFTGGVGARAEGEAFGAPYELPNARAYGESCAAIGNMMWNWRMLAATGEARFTDVIERSLYNGINSGMSLDGKTYCYRNPLAFDPAGDSRDRHTPEGKIRNPWYDTTCCPPNLERTFASLPGYFYSSSADGIYVHLYDNSQMDWRLHDGTALRVTQKTNYPWDGDVHLTVAPERPTEFVVYVRIPGWSETNSVKVNGELISGATPGQYLQIRRRWSGNDRIDLVFDMTPRAVKANPAVMEDTGKIAFQRGPIVYCMETLDQQGYSQDINSAGFVAQIEGKTTATWDSRLLDGVVVLEHPGTVSERTKGSLYSSATAKVPPSTPSSIRLIPYYAWANRGPAGMQVWIPYVRG
jgi:DUF1680 family protein